MNSIQKKIEDELLTARKTKDSITKELLILIKANIKNSEIELKSQLNDSQVFAVLKKEMKQMNDSLDSAIKAKRQDLIDMNQKKISILKPFLPKTLSKTEIKEILILNNATTEMKKGQLIGLVMKEHKNEVDGSDVSFVVDEFLK